MFERPEDGIIGRMAHPEIVGVDDQKTGISRISKQTVGVAFFQWKASMADSQVVHSTDYKFFPSRTSVVDKVEE